MLFEILLWRQVWCFSPIFTYSRNLQIKNNIFFILFIFILDSYSLIFFVFDEYNWFRTFCFIIKLYFDILLSIIFYNNFSLLYSIHFDNLVFLFALILLFRRKWICSPFSHYCFIKFLFVLVLIGISSFDILCSYYLMQF